jgi:hypothetical protein
LRYLQDLIAKKKTPTNNSHIALSIEEIESFINSLRIDPDILLLGASLLCLELCILIADAVK